MIRYLLITGQACQHLHNSSGRMHFHSRALEIEACHSFSRVTETLNYKFQVFVLISIDSILAAVPEYISSYKNIIFVKVNFFKLVNNTSPSKLWESGEITRSGFYHNNISNVLRILLLLKFGGVYLDSDVISIQQLPQDQVIIVKGVLTNL